MKFAKLLAIACIGSVATQEKWADDFDAEEEFEQEEKVYDDKEKLKWIYGEPGDPDYKTELSAEELLMREEMWAIDLTVQ